MKKMIIPMVVLFASLSMMSFRSQSSYEEELVDLKNYSVNHKLVYSHVLALRDGSDEEAQKAIGIGSLLKWAWKKDCKLLVWDLVHDLMGNSVMTVEQVSELERQGILKKL